MINIQAKNIPEALRKLEEYFNTDRAAAANLSQEERSLLYQWVQHPGWRVGLKLMEQECKYQETILISTPGEQKEKVAHEHAMSRAFWLFFKRFQDQVKHEVQELFDDVREELEEIEAEKELVL
jgi:hypothetical protein